MTTGTDDEWGRPIDPMVDSDAPDQIALELGRRHALYLREAQRLVLEGAVPDEGGLTAGIKAETARYLRSQPWLAVDALAPAVAGVERTSIAALRTIVATAVVPPTPAPPPARPIRRLALQPSATIVGNMAVRKQPTERGLELGRERLCLTLDVILTWIGPHAHARGGKIVRRAVISALTSGNSGAQWKRQATAS